MSSRISGLLDVRVVFQRKQVRQFHLEPLPKNYVPDKDKKDSVLKVNKIKYLRSPDWSLGGYILEKDTRKCKVG